MKYLICIIVLNLICLSVIVGDEINNNYRILVPGCFHGSEIAPVNDNDWYGFFKTDSGYVIEYVNVNTSPCYDALDYPSAETTGVSVSIDRDLNPTILIQCPKKLKTGTVPTTFFENYPLEPGKPVFLKGFERGVSYTLTVLGEISDEGGRGPGDLLILNYTLKLYKRSGSSESQVLVQYERSSYDGLPSVLWAGDIDRDGRLDLLLDIRNHYNVTHYALYLSSEANDGDLVNFVAELRLTGC